MAVHHFKKLTQGNVGAATTLAALRLDETTYDYFVFFGCAGSYGPLTNEAHVVESVMYAALGEVKTVAGEPCGDANSPHEAFELKSKWMFPTEDSSVHRLRWLDFPLASKLRTPRPRASVVSTEAVVLVDTSVHNGPSEKFDAKNHEFERGATMGFSETLAHVDHSTEMPLLIDMESYGIASLMYAMDLSHRVLVVRVPTDGLSDKLDQTKTSQADLLRENSDALAEILSELGTAERWSGSEEEAHERVGRAMVDQQVVEALANPAALALLDTNVASRLAQTFKVDPAVVDGLANVEIPDFSSILRDVDVADVTAAVTDTHLRNLLTDLELPDFTSIFEDLEVPDVSAAFTDTVLPSLADWDLSNAAREQLADALQLPNFRALLSDELVESFGTPETEAVVQAWIRGEQSGEPQG